MGARGGGSGEEKGWGGQGEWGREPSKPSSLSSGACGLSLQPGEGRSVGSQPRNQAPGQRGLRQAAVTPPWAAGREAGAHGPSGIWAWSSWPGLRLELAPGDSPGGRSAPYPPGC